MSIERKDDHDHDAWMEERDLTALESIYLTVLIWLDKRLRIVDYLELLEDLYYKVNMQMPKSHTEQYNLDNKFWYWYPLYALGSFSTIAYVVAAISGALLGFYYAPAAAAADGTPSVAYESILFIMGDLNLGLFLRSLHRWSAQIMVAAVFLHMLRVYFTGAYKEPRELNWIIGVRARVLLDDCLRHRRDQRRVAGFLLRAGSGRRRRHPVGRLRVDPLYHG